MHSKTSAFLKVLVNKFHPGIAPAFFKSLPQEDVKAAFAEVTTSDDTSLAFNWPSTLIARTHYSWLVQTIEKLPESLKIPVLNALPEGHSQRIKKLLKIKFSPSVLTPNAKAFLLGLLYQQWQPKEAVPFEYLPPSNLNVIFELSKSQLVELIDLLAIYDLAEAIRHIVDKKNLKALYLCLTTQKQQFLRMCLHKKEKLAASKLDIGKWDGSQEQLNGILHRRGMVRFGKALCGQNKNFFWNIVHTLDTGRGNMLISYFKEEPIAGVTPLLVLQVISVINFLKPKSNV